MPDDLQEEYEALQAMHDAEHRKEVELEKERYGPDPLSADEQMNRDWKRDQRIDFAIAEALSKLTTLRPLLEERFRGHYLGAVDECVHELQEVRAQAVRRWD